MYFILLVGNVVVTSMTSGLYVVQPDYEAMEAVATDHSYREQIRCVCQGHVTLTVMPLVVTTNMKVVKSTH